MRRSPPIWRFSPSSRSSRRRWGSAGSGELSAMPRQKAESAWSSESQPLDAQVTELHARARMMVLQSNVTFQRAIAIQERADRLTVQGDRDLVANRLNFVCVPLAQRFG